MILQCVTFMSNTSQTYVLFLYTLVMVWFVNFPLKLV